MISRILIGVAVILPWAARDEVGCLCCRHVRRRRVRRVPFHHGTLSPAGARAGRGTAGREPVGAAGGRAHWQLCRRPKLPTALKERVKGREEVATGEG